ncbi:MAG: hypothetical protein GX629_01540 [Phycisphaerae bacterium]|jgi:transcription elongation factor Elf1|nr:hypothetical protein [Phycisphaerae bacterium]
MAKMRCPNCDEEMLVEDAALQGVLDDESGIINCNACGEKFEVPHEIREELQAKRDYEDLAMLDFAGGEGIDEDFD